MARRRAHGIDGNLEGKVAEPSLELRVGAQPSLLGTRPGVHPLLGMRDDLAAGAEVLLDGMSGVVGSVWHGEGWGGGEEGQGGVWIATGRGVESNLGCRHTFECLVMVVRVWCILCGWEWDEGGRAGRGAGFRG